MMISVLGNRKQTCDGLTRRDALTAGGLSLLGASLPDLLAAESAQGGPGRDSAAQQEA